MWAGFWGLLLHRNHEVYGYIAESLQGFPDRVRLRDIFRDKGFTVMASRLYFFGITELLVVRKATRACGVASGTGSSTARGVEADVH